MTTGWLIVNIVLVTVVAAIVAVPAVLIPYRLDRDIPRTVRIPRRVKGTLPARSWPADRQRSADAA